MKKENRKMAQQRRAEARRKKEFQKKVSKALVIGIPSLAVLALVIVLIVDAVNNRDTAAQTDDKTTESTADTSGTDTDTNADSDDTDNSSDDNAYSTDTSLTVADDDTVNIDYVGTVDGVEFSGGNTQGTGTDLVIGSGSYIDDFEEQLIGAHPGDTVEVNVTFPDPYGNNEDLSGKDAVFTVTVNEIYK